MSLERRTWTIALMWASFRMIADVIGRSIYAGLELLAYLMQLALNAMIVGAAAMGFYWLWTNMNPF